MEDPKDSDRLVARGDFFFGAFQLPSVADNPIYKHVTRLAPGFAKQDFNYG